MKKVTARMFHALLAVIILVSGMSFTVKKMVCLSSGSVQVGLYSLDGCCGEEETSCEDTKLGSKCCDYSSQALSLDKDIVLKESSLKQVDLELSQFTPAHNYGIQLQLQKEPLYSFADLPPPLSGRQLLTFISILII